MVKKEKEVKTIQESDNRQKVDKKLITFFESLATSAPEIEEIIDTDAFWLVRVDRTKKINFKIYGIQKHETRHKRLFKNHEFKRVDLSRIIKPSLRYHITAAPYSCILPSKMLVTCNIGIKNSTGELTAQFFPVQRN